MLQLSNLNNILPDSTWVTIGTFDGVHIGHQALISDMVKNAHIAGKKAVVVSFHPHPGVILGRRRGDNNITTPMERSVYLADLGVDILFDQLFDTQLATTSAKDYILNLKAHLNMEQLWVGHDFALGRNREGDVNSLKKLGEEFNFEVVEVAPLMVNGEVVSSSRIRKYLWSGDVQGAAYLLSRPYKLAGEVIKEDQRGRMIGFPTANIAVPDEKLIPARGVYSCLIEYQNQWMPAATNIGVRPTFDGKDEKLHVETHIIDFSGNLYGYELSVEFIQQLRGEIRFSGIQELVEQITKDIDATRGIVKAYLESKTL